MGRHPALTKTTPLPLAGPPITMLVPGSIAPSDVKKIAIDTIYRAHIEYCEDLPSNELSCQEVVGVKDTDDTAASQCQSAVDGIIEPRVFSAPNASLDVCGDPES